MSFADLAAVFGMMATFHGLLYFSLRHQIMDLGNSVRGQIEHGKQEHAEFRQDIKQLYQQFGEINGKLDLLIAQAPKKGPP